MNTKNIAGQTITEHFFNTIVVGAGAAGMNCAKKLYEYMDQKGVDQPEKRIAVVTAGLPLGASRMSGSDKQTYYKMGTSPDIADSAESFAKSLTGGGCCHGDLALAEGIGSLRGFYNLVEAGVPFPNDPMGTYIGYKTDHDPYERATSAGPKTSKFMSQCLEKIIRRFGVEIFDHQEAVEFLTTGQGDDKRIIGIVTLNRKAVADDNFGINVFYFENLVLAAGGPGALYETSVYPLGQTGIHGIAFKAGLAGENLTESQFGLASTKFRWNVSGTYMQVVPRILSTDADGNDEREFLTDFFPSMSKMATDIFLKGYQWPFDPQRIENHQSSLVDVIVFNETQKGRRVFMDFLKNPIGNNKMDAFAIEDLEDEALDYLKGTDAMQSLPIERLEHMNQPAIDIYTESNSKKYKTHFKKTTGYAWDDFFMHESKRRMSYGGCFSRIIMITDKASVDALIMDTWMTDPYVVAFDAMYYIVKILEGEKAIKPDVPENADIYQITKYYAWLSAKTNWRDMIIKVYDELPKDIHNIIIPVIMTICASVGGADMFKDPIYWNNSVVA
jgi:succinate dehydrogenase/fumarate reductase flavoprotein subunit